MGDSRIPMTWTRNAACIVAIFVVVSFPQIATAGNSYLRQAEVSESNGTIRIVANSPRPLEQVLDALDLKYKWDVNYEDPQFVSKLDLVEAEGPAGNLLPAGMPFTVEFPAATEEEKVLKAIVDSYNSSTSPGRFELRKSAQGQFSVVGAQARDVRGQLTRQPVPFDAPITIPSQERNISDTLSLICQKVSAEEHIEVTMGVSPRNLLSGTDVTVGGSPASARDLLLQALSSTHRHLYWRLLFDPTTKTYLFSVQLMPK
jgi:hypothetical protein